MCNKEKFWPVLCKALGRNEWAADPRFAGFKYRLKNRAVIEEMLDAELAKKMTAEWLKIFAGIVPAAPINNLAQALDNPFVIERGGIQTLQLEGHGPYRMLNSPVRCEGEETPVNPAPRLGQHTNELLRGIGYDDAKLKVLRKEKVI